MQRKEQEELHKSISNEMKVFLVREMKSERAMQGGYRAEAAEEKEQDTLHGWREEWIVSI